MDYLHSLGVLHGDVKGANVLLKTTAPTAYDARGFVCKVSPSCLNHHACFTEETGILSTCGVGFSLGLKACCCVMQMADFGLSRVLESDATHVSTFTYGVRLLLSLDQKQGCIRLLSPIRCGLMLLRGPPQTQKAVSS